MKTVEAEAEKTQVWYFNRIALVQEFDRRSIMPPFVILDLIFGLLRGFFNFIIQSPNRITNCFGSTSVCSPIKRKTPWENPVWPDAYIHCLRKHEMKCMFEFFDLKLPHQNPKTDGERTQNYIYAVKEDIQQSIEALKRDIADEQLALFDKRISSLEKTVVSLEKTVVSLKNELLTSHERILTLLKPRMELSESTVEQGFST